ncbi:MAG: hypothetical protein ACFFDD_13900 [Promethearchaeota archaeon]
MNNTDSIRLDKPENREARKSGGIKSLLMFLGVILAWALISAMTVGSFTAAIWTAIPTALLPWGASYENLVGYVSHCPFAPASTLILLFVGILGIFFAYKLKKGRGIGYGVFAGTMGGLLIGLLGGIDIVMFMGMGAGVGVGVFLGLVIGLVGKAGM